MVGEQKPGADPHRFDRRSLAIDTQKVAARWPMAQQVVVQPDVWKALPQEERHRIEERARSRIVAGIKESEQATTHEDLEKERRLAARLRSPGRLLAVLLTVTALLLAVALVVAWYIVTSPREIRSLEAEFRRRCFYCAVEGWGTVWREGSPAEGRPASVAAFGLTDKTELQPWLETERSNLARFVEPAALRLQVLQLTGQWRSILSGVKEALDRPAEASSLNALERYIQDDLTRLVTLEDCRKIDTPASTVSGDFFVSRKNALQREVYGTCASQVAPEARRRYDMVEGLFNSRLAAKSPFSRAEATVVPSEVDPKDLEAFFGKLEELKRLLPPDFERWEHIFGEDARVVADFVDSVGNSPAVLAAYPFTVELTNADQSVGLNALELCRFRVGDRYIGCHGDELVQWRIGDSVSLELKFRSGLRPAPGPEYAIIGPRTVEFRHNGRWALIDLLVSHQPRRWNFRDLKTVPGVTIFAVELVNDAPDDQLGVQLFMRLRQLQDRPIELRAFPVLAPRLSRGPGRGLR